MRTVTRLVLVTLVAVLAGCGGEDSTTMTTGATARALPDCTPMEPGASDRFLLCRRSGASDRGSFVFRGRGRIPIAYPYDAPSGHWSGGFLSPDGRTLLLQWTAECEVPFALFVPARGGTPRFVFGERHVDAARPAIAHGWTRDGRAIVETFSTCNAARPGAAATELWLVTPFGEKHRLAPTG